MFNFSNISHLFKLVWNRRSANSLIMIELLAAFLVLFCVCLSLIFFGAMLRKPLGYEYKDVWTVNLYRKGELAPISQAERMQTAQNIVAALRRLPEVESVSFASILPFGFAHRTTNYGRGDAFRTEILSGTDELPQTLGITLTQGRWFNESDDMYNGTTSTVKPVIVTELTAARFLGTTDPVGKDITYGTREGISQEEQRMRYRIVGIVKEFRTHSEIDQPTPTLFERINLRDTTVWLPENMLIKMKSGTSVAFEETLLRTLHGQAPDWTFQISSLEANRARKNKMYIIPFVLGFTVAFFLLLMVALGLIGVVWQSVMRRMRELGVRRAFGATKENIYLFVMGELVALTTFAVAFGIALIMQVPLLPVYDIPKSIFIGSIAITILSMYVLVMLCALYPSQIAARILPSDALRYE